MYPSDSFCLQTDTSGLGIGAVLSVNRDGKYQAVAYYSQKLTAQERNYSASELEGVAVVSSVNHFAVYLYGIKFTMVRLGKDFSKTCSNTWTLGSAQRQTTEL